MAWCWCNATESKPPNVRRNYKTRIMIKELLVSFKENIESKSTNPFFGTFILIWIIKNWNLFYSLFNFNPKTTLEQKRNFIVQHFKDNPLLETILWSVLKAIIVLVISYLLINLSRLIINFFEKKITPLMYKWTDKNSVVLKSVYDTSEENRIRLEKKVEDERTAKLRLQEEYEKLEKRFAEFVLKHQTTNDTNNPENPKIQDSDSAIIPNSNDRALLIFNKFKRDERLNEFEEFAENILNGIPIKKENPLVREFRTLGLITHSTSYSTDASYYKLTEDGKKLHEALLFDKLK